MSIDDEKLVEALNNYHRENLCSNKKIAARLLADHNIRMRYIHVAVLAHKND